MNNKPWSPDLFGARNVEGGAEVSAESILTSFAEVLAKAFPRAETERKEGKARTVYIVALKGELLLNTKEIEAFLKTEGFDAAHIKNTVQFYKELNKIGSLPNKIKVPVSEARDAGNWIEPYMYPARLKIWQGKRGGGVSSNNAEECVWYRSITTGTGISSKEITG